MKNRFFKLMALMVMIFMGISLVKVNAENAEDYKLIELGGEYSDDYLLNHYQVITFGDVKLTSHFIGSVLIQGDFTGHGSGYADGRWSQENTYSYVQGKVTYPGYYGSRTYNGANALPLYLSTQNEPYTKLGPNMSVQYTDKFVNWDKVRYVVDTTSQGMLRASKPVGEGYTFSKNYAQIDIPAGSNITLDPNDPHINTDGWLEYNIVGESEKTTVINILNEESFNLRFVNVNGSQFQGKENVNGEETVGIVWNIPNCKGTVTAPSVAWVGHIIAPDAKVVIPSTNVNGGIVCRELDCAAECHTYPFNGHIELNDYKELEEKENPDLVETTRSGYPKKKLPEAPTAVTVSGEKTWDDENNKMKARPDSIKVHLLADGKDTGKEATVTPDAKGEWKYEFTGLPEKNDDDSTIVYTIKEDAVDNYTTTYSADGKGITNTYILEKTNISGTNTWEDDNNKWKVRPASIKVKLLSNGTDTGQTKTVTPNANGEWKYTFENLPLKDDTGKVITYTVEEEAVDNYKTTYSADGKGITNTYIPEKTTVSGTKTWEDGDNTYGVRPANIHITLLADGKATGKDATITPDGVGAWKYTFNDLALKDDTGKVITYTVKEDAVDHYTTSYSKDGKNIINTYIPDKTSISGVKTWEDDNNKWNVRPESIKVKLLSNGTDTGQTKTVTPNANGEWKYTFENLPLKDDTGKVITYTVEEEAVDNYKTTYSADGKGITNTYIPEKTTVSGTKTWVDDNNKWKVRPASIEVTLYKNGNRTNRVLEVKPDTNNEWVYTFENLPLKDDTGKIISYTVKEKAVEHYTTTYSEDGKNITNTYKEEKKEDKKPNLDISISKDEGHGGAHGKEKETYKKYEKEDLDNKTGYKTGVVLGNSFITTIISLGAISGISMFLSKKKED